MTIPTLPVLAITPLPGDITLCQGIDPVTGKGLMFPRIIAHCQRNVAEEYTDWEATWTHPGILEHWGPVRGTGRAHRVIEAKGLGITKHYYSDQRQHWVVLRDLRLTERATRTRIVDQMDAMVGDPYAWRDVCVMLLRHWFHRLARMHCDREASAFCSEAVALAYRAAGVPLPTTVEPSAMWPAEVARLWRRGHLVCIYDSHDH